MGNRYTGGFTIIEVMLFLAVSGALTVGILASSSIAINQQRYHDTLNSLQSLVQQQFTDASHVTNSRNKDSKCDTSGVSDAGGGDLPEARGTSECLILGRRVTFSSGGKDINIVSVVGYKTTPDSADPAENDIDAIKEYKLFLAPSTSSIKTSVAWGANVQLKGTTAKDFSILIVRSPLTGSLRTFSYIDSSDSSTISPEFITADNMKEQVMCVEPGGFTIASTLGVVIRANAASSSAVELLQDNSGC